VISYEMATPSVAVVVALNSRYPSVVEKAQDRFALLCAFRDPRSIGRLPRRQQAGECRFWLSYPCLID